MIARLVPAFLLCLFGVAFLAPGLAAETTDATVEFRGTVLRIAEDRHALVVRVHRAEHDFPVIVRVTDRTRISQGDRRIRFSDIEVGHHIYVAGRRERNDHQRRPVVVARRIIVAPRDRG